jgi:tetratricopeptide (TPR) repeat protein
MTIASASAANPWRLLVVLFCTMGGLLISGRLAANVVKPPSDQFGSTNLFEVINQGALTLAPTARPLAADIAQDPQRHIRELKEDVTRGKLGRIKPVGDILLRVDPGHLEMNGLYALYLAAIGRYKEAREHWERARPLPADDWVPQLAEAMILRGEKDASGAIRVAKRVIDFNPRHPYAWNVLGRSYLDAGQFTNALSSFSQAVELNQAFQPGHVNLGALYFLSGDYGKSVEAYRRAAQLEPSDVSCRYGLALAYDALGISAAAMGELQEALRQQPDHRISLLKLTEIQVREGLWEPAVTNAQRMLSQRMPAAHLLLADALMQKGDYTAALHHLTNAPAATPQREYLSGYCMLATSRHAEALTAMEKALALDANHSGAWLAQSVLQLHFGQPSDLSGHFPSRQPIELKPLFHFLQGCSHAASTNWAQAWDAFRAAEGFLPGFSLAGIEVSALPKSIPPAEAPNLAMGVLLHLKHLQAPALDSIEHVLKAKPRSFLAHYWAGVLHLKQGKREVAHAHFVKSTEETPNFFAGLFASGELSFTSGNPEQAALYYRRAQAVKPDASLSMRLGLYYENTGDLVRAEQEYRKVVELAPNFFAGYNQLAWFLARRGQKLDEALRLAQRADALLPGNGSILDTLGWIFHLTGKPELASEHLTRAVEADPNNPTIWYHLGVVHHSRGSKAQAKQSLEKALAISNRFADAGDARKLLDQVR